MEDDALRKLLVESLVSMLPAMQEGVSPEWTTPLDIVFAYRLLLLRPPEALSVAALQQRSEEFPSVVQLSRGFLSTNEFRNKYHGVSQREDGRTVIVRYGTRRIAVSLDDNAIGGEIINGTYEPELEWIIGRLVGPGDVCVDVGANVGYFTSLLGTLVSPRGHVFAYEPFGPVCKLLRITVEETQIVSTVTVIEKAASDQSGTATLLSAAETDNFGGAHLANSDPSTMEGLARTTIETVTLDEDLAQAAAGKIAFVKMDVEGLELSALRGFAKRIRSDRPIIVLEVNHACLAKQGVDATDLFALLTDHDYTLYSSEGLYERTLVQPLDKGSICHLGEYANICAIPNESRNAVLAKLEISVA